MLTKQALLRVIADQREALLGRPAGVEREIISRVSSYLDVPHVIVISGLRRCGKSTLMRQVIKKYFKDDDFYYINFEDERLLQFSASDFNLVYEAQLELYGEKSTFFIDEIQEVKDFDRFLRRFYDAGMKFIISGSNASLLREDIGSRLTGRHLDIILKPFSFIEFLAARKETPPSPASLTTRARVAMKKLFDEYLVAGGMPERVIFENDEILANIYDDIIIKDIIARHGINDKKSIREVYQYLVSNFCRKFSYNKIAKMIGIGSPNTVKNYIQHIEDTFLGVVLPRFEHSVGKQVIAEKKFYIQDNGFIGRVSPVVTVDTGWLLENYVVTTIKYGDNVYYYQGNGECDVLTREQGKITSSMQVTRDLTDRNKTRELGGLVEAMDAFHVDAGIIITQDQEDEFQHAGKVIRVLPAWKWALEQASSTPWHHAVPVQ